jgi:hypothetical protein
MKPIVAASLVFVLFTSVAHADLRYMTRVDVRKTSSTEPFPGQLAAALQVLMPPGETRTFVRADTMRIEQTAGTTPMVTLIRPDGQFVLFPDSQTYARVPLPGVVPTAPGQPPALSARRTGEFATLLGLRAERILVTMSIGLPIIPPAGFPTTMSLEGELWLADAYRTEAGGLRKLMGRAANVPDGFEGMVLRQVLRNKQLGYEVETRVTELIEGPIDAALFDIPDGYRPAELLTPGLPSGSRR